MRTCTSPISIVIPKGRVLVTGVNGFIGMHIARTLIERGYTMIGAVRHESKTAQLQRLLPQAITSGPLTFGIVLDIAKPGADREQPFDAVAHTGSPISFALEDVERDICQPAIEGTLDTLKSVKNRASSVKRVIIASSFVAIADRSKGARPGNTYSEEDWSPVTRVQGLDNVRIAYTTSKILAEKAAWNFVETEKPNFTITTLCPPFPVDQITSIRDLNETMAMIYAVFEGKTLTPISGYVWVDVRDIALAHALAIESAAAPKQRYLIAGSQGKPQGAGSARQHQMTLRRLHSAQETDKPIRAYGASSGAAERSRPPEVFLERGKYSPQQVMDYIWEKYPERAKEKSISKGTPGNLWPEGDVFDVDTTKSQRDLSLKYRVFEESISDTFSRLIALDSEV